MSYPFVEALGRSEKDRIDDYLEHLKGRDLDPELEALRFLLEDVLILRHHPSIGGFILYSRSLGKYFSLTGVRLLLRALMNEYADAEIIQHLNSIEFEKQNQYRPNGDSKEQTPSPGFIYLLRGADYYKIGMSANVNNRLTQISPHLPFEVELIHTFAVEDMVDAERRLHDRFADKRTNGEWFKLTEADVEYIKTLGLQDD